MPSSPLVFGNTESLEIKVDKKSNNTPSHRMQSAVSETLLDKDNPNGTQDFIKNVMLRSTGTLNASCKSKTKNYTDVVVKVAKEEMVTQSNTMTFEQSKDN